MRVFFLLLVLAIVGCSDRPRYRAPSSDKPPKMMMVPRMGKVGPMFIPVPDNDESE